MVLTAASWLGQVLNLGLQLVLARMLGPGAVGLYAFTLAIGEFLNIVGAFSMQHALVQDRGESQERYDTAFAICAGLGLVMLLIAAALHPLVGHWRSPEAGWILLLIAAAGAARLLTQVPQARLERALRYAPISWIALGTSVVPNVVAVGLAGLGLGAWALALRDVLVAGSCLAFSMGVSGYRFRGRLAAGSWRSLMDYGRPMFVSRGLEILMERLDLLAAGAFLGNRAAGIYYWARTLSEAGYVATRPLERVSLNVYARLQDDPARLSRAFSLVNTLLARVLMSGSAALLVFPAETVHLLLGEAWLDTAPVLRWLGLYATLLPLLHNAKVLYYGLARIRQMVRIRVAQLLLFAAGVAASSLLGRLDVMAAGLLISTGAALALAWAWGRELADLSPARILSTPLALLAATAAGFLSLGRLGALDALPWWALPFLPPLTLLLALVAVERSSLLASARFLIDQGRPVGR